MNHGPVIILFRGHPVRFYRAAGNNVCELCTPDAATVFATPANARAKAILHRFAFEDYCMARPVQIPGRKKMQTVLNEEIKQQALP